MKAVEKIEQHYLIKQLPKATALVSNDGTLVDVSDSWKELFGKKFNPKSPITIRSIFTDVENLDIKLLGGQTKSIRHQLKRETETLWLESYFTPWFDDKENLMGTIVQTDNISREIEAELQLERVNTILKTKSEVAKVGCWEFDVKTEEVFWCDETKKIHQVPSSYVPNVNEAINFYKQGYSRNKISMLFHKILKDGKPYSQKLQIITHLGEERWVHAAGKAIIENGEIVRLFGTFQDIHDEMEAEAKIKGNEQLLTTLIDNLPLNVFVKDLDSKKILVNKAECEYLGKTPEELLGKSDFDLYDKEVAKISRDEDLEVIRTLKPILGKETISIKKDGQITNFLTSKIPLFDIDGKINGLIGISMDITPIKKKEEQLQHLINITSVQNKKLINFAHIVSHNLRSHSANFSMLLQFLNSEENEEERNKILKMLEQASDNLLETLSNLNEVVDINTNINLKKVPIQLNHAITKAQQNLAALLDKNKVIIENQVDKNLSVLSIPAYLDSILLNLLTNAVKYRSPDRQPKITIKAKRIGGKIMLDFSDNGLGIDLERYGDKIFGMYKTFHNNKDAKGFGLYLIRNQIEAMGGHIIVDSKVDAGTTFKVYFNEESK
ncbi:MAG: PAS domain-containing sensor histidine kinase [Allomuricauda sp.]